MGPIGAEDIIADKFFHEIAEKENLEILEDLPGAGLLESMDDLGFEEDERLRLNKQVRDFYEHTSNYNFEVWSEWRGLFKPFGSLLHVLFSKRLQQLNLPMSSIDTAKGMKSQVIKLKRKDQSTAYTVWYRIIKSNKNVIYSGVYDTCDHPNHTKPLLKVVFPLPNGNASVVMKKEVKEDGSLLLSSDGKRFGDHGFYFTLTNHNGKYWAKFVRAMHEWIHVYEDEEGVLRADHNLNFYGVRFLDLHYKMVKK